VSEAGQDTVGGTPRASEGDARAVVLGRIAAALGDVPAAERPGDVRVSRGYRGVDAEPTGAGVDRDAVVARFAERVADYRAQLLRVGPGEVGAALAAACAERGLRRVAVAPGLPADRRPDAPRAAPGGRPDAAGLLLVEDGGLSARELDALDGAVTGCAAAIAETGTLVLDGSPRSGRRLLTLVPDHHLCVVEADQITAGVPAALAAVATAVVRDRRPITLVSGPSASSDIELERVEGVHGPRDLLVVVVEPH
jgi:L-lactate dehydrogenase complex protein LldG